MDGLLHIKNVISDIDRYKRNEKFFDLAKELILKEFEFAKSENIPGYAHNLKQTIDKQLAVYIAMKKKRPVRGAPSEYYDFLSNFLSDSYSALAFYEIKIRPTPGENKV